MDVKPLKILLDTNIIISAIGFGGKPRIILQLILDKKIKAVTSPVLLAELADVVAKKFPKLADNFEITMKQIKHKFKVIQPVKTVSMVNDEDDNRVLEAADEGDSDFIITGDKELLELGKFKGIQIVTAMQFLTRVNF